MKSHAIVKNIDATILVKTLTLGRPFGPFLRCFRSVLPFGPFLRSFRFLPYRMIRLKAQNLHALIFLMSRIRIWCRNLKGVTIVCDISMKFGTKLKLQCELSSYSLKYHLCIFTRAPIMLRSRRSRSLRPLRLMPNEKTSHNQFRPSYLEGLPIKKNNEQWIHKILYKIDAKKGKVAAGK